MPLAGGGRGSMSLRPAIRCNFTKTSIEKSYLAAATEIRAAAFVPPRRIAAIAVFAIILTLTAKVDTIHRIDDCYFLDKIQAAMI